MVFTDAQISSQLNTLLNQVRYSDVSRVRKDVTALVLEYRSLSPKVGSLMQNNGIESRVLYLSGTIPIFYQMHQYNIPVDLYLKESYPREPPQIYVRPTSNMMIKSQHQHVDMQGLVYLPYLHEWTVSSDLVSLVEITCQVFSIAPPLFAKPPQASPASSSITVQATSASAAAAVAYPSSVAQYTTASASPVAEHNPTPLATASYINTNWTNYNNTGAGVGTSGSNSKSSAYEEANAAAVAATAASAAEVTSRRQAAAEQQQRAELVDKVTMRLYMEIDAKQRDLRGAILKEFSNSSYLEKNHDLAQANRDDVRQRMEHSSDAIKAIEFKKLHLHEWVSEQEAKGPIDCETLVQCSDPLSEQLATVIGSLNAIDDAFYYLERALTNYHNKDIDLDTFLKESRLLARKQFMNKVHLKKIAAYCEQHEQAARAAQQQQQHQYAAMNAVPQYYVPPRPYG